MNNGIPAVDKSVQILEMLSEAPASQGELSKALGISMSTAYRILQTLACRDWVKKDDRGTYFLASGVLTLFKPFDRDLEILKRARHKVDELCCLCHTACKLSLRRGNLQITEYRAEPEGPVTLTGVPGSTFPLAEGSVGAALLADDSDENIMSCLAGCDAPIPEKEEPELLRAAVAEVRRNNCAFNMRKNRWSIAALSVPLRNSSGRIFAALTLIGSAGDFAGNRRKKYEELLKKAVFECESM